MKLIIWDGNVQGIAARVWFDIPGANPAAAGPVEALGFTVSAGGHTAAGHLVMETPVAFVAVLAGAEGPAGEFKLASWEQAVGDQPDQARQRERDIEQFVTAMREPKVMLTGASASGLAAGFLGVSAVAGAAVSCTLTVDVGALLAGDTRAPLFCATLNAELAGFACAPVGAAAVAAKLSFELVLTRDALLQLLPRISLPDYPGLAIRWPRIRLPQFDGEIGFGAFPLGSMDLDGLFALPLPASALKVVLDTRPALAFTVTAGELTIATTTPGAGRILLDQVTLLEFSDLELIATSAARSLSATFTAKAQAPVSLPDLLVPEALSGPFEIRLSGITATGTGVASTAPPEIGLAIKLDIERIEIRARSDPSLVLALSATVTCTVKNGDFKPALERIVLIEPYPLELAAAAAHVIADKSRKLWALVQKVPMPGAPAAPGMPSAAGALALLRRIGEMIGAAARWLAQKGLAGARALADLAEAALAMLGRLIEQIAGAAPPAFGGLALEFRIDLSTMRLVQIVISPLEPAGAPLPAPLSVLGLKLSVPYSLAPSVVCDLRDEWIALVVNATAGPQDSITLSTDLWLAGDAQTESVSGTQQGDAHQPLIEIRATPNTSSRAIALVVLQGGKARFFQKITNDLTTQDIVGQNGAVVVKAGTRLIGSRIEKHDEFDAEFDITVKCDPDRILSLFKVPSEQPAHPADDSSWSQCVKIKSVTVAGAPVNGVATVRVEGEVKIAGLGQGQAGTALPIDFDISLDLETLSAKIAGGGIDIAMADPTTFSLLGLTARVRDIRVLPRPPMFAPFRFDLNNGNPRLMMNPDVAAIDLSYDKLSAGSSNLEFTVKSFAVARDGIDLEAATKDSPVTLAGVDMPFRFDHGTLSVKQGRIQAFALQGHGNLPPALVGEAKASILLNFAQQGGQLALQACDAVLDKSGDPLRCESTRFTLNIDKLGLKIVEQSGYQFYFTLTGYAQFRPNGDEFSNGLLKNLSKLKILLKEVPLASDPRVLLQHIEFQVPVEPPDRTNFFDIFSFELKGIGFHPASPAFDGAPALSISGQVRFTDFCDDFNPRFDFHQLWIAPPQAGKSLPRVRMDGLGVGLTLGSTAEVSATAIAVDGKLPTMEGAAPPEQGVTGKGFLASGSLTLKGWASMSASMGFLELEKEGRDEKRHAFFLYIQQNDISIPIRTPIGELHIRELGYGLGYRYTLAGLAAADQAETPRQLVKLLDGISRYQGDLHKVSAWAPTYDNSDLTLAMRALVSIASMSPENGYNPEEAEIPNLVLFDIVAALRTDLTFLMNLRAWIAFNYSDWRRGRMKGGEPWQTRPSLTGYMYLSVRKQEFLARLISNPDCVVGEHPALYPPLIQAMKAVRWSSTLYVRPGLFHQEMGWPYELGFSLNTPNDNFYLSVEGGTVLRFEDASLLYGLAFRARGHIRFAADSGGDFGASVSGTAALALAAKFIACLSSRSQDAMLYGALSLDITIEFSVHIWLNARFFSASADFSASFTIHVAAELVIAPAGVAGHIEASVSVSAFGCSLSLGIGFDIGDRGQLEDARRRSERFMTLGLGADYPDPQAGVPLNRPPLPQPAPKANSAIADDEVLKAARHRENQPRDATRRDAAKLAALPGIDFGDTSFLAMLYPVDSDDGQPYYLVQLIPKNVQDAALGQGDHFYAPPLPLLAPGVPPEYEISLTQGQFDAGELLMMAPGQQTVVAPNRLTCTTRWDARVGRPGHGAAGHDQSPTLAHYFSGACFMAATPALELSNCPSLPFKTCPLPEDAAARNKVLARATRSRADLGDRDARGMQVREARSAFVATVGETAGRLAASVYVKNGVVTPPSDQQLELLDLDFDPRALGLTFVFSGARIAALFPSAAAPDMTIGARLPRKPAVLCNPTPVAAFNPPDKMFRASPPRLADRCFLLLPCGVHLFWDLEPAWTRGTREDDPEFHVKHYRIERRIKGAGFGRRIFTVKRASTLEFDASTGTLEVTAHSSRLTLVDDLADLPDAVRAQIVPAALAAQEQADGRPPAAKADRLLDAPELHYLILAVDCAGTFSHPVPWPIAPQQPKRTQPTFGRPIARFHYDAMPGLGRWPAAPGAAVPEDFLSLYVEEPSKAPPGADKSLAPVFASDEAQPIRVRLRTERTISIGLFGSDALTQARATPPLPRADRDAGANEVDLVLMPLSRLAAGTGTVVVKVQRVPMAMAGFKAPDPDLDGQVASYTLGADEWQRMRIALDIPPDNVRVRRSLATRMYLRPQPSEEAGLLPPEWVPVQLQLRIGAAPVKAGRGPRDPLPAAPVDITVERFEHPVDVRFQALAGDIYPSSGRLFVLHPKADSSYADCSGIPLADAQRRTAVRIAWEAQPDSLAAIGAPAAKAQDLESMVAGFDLFALDTASVPTSGNALEHVVHLGRAQRLPSAERGQEPSETGDLATLEALYPSLTRRLGHGGAAATAKATWYSGAESFLRWPRRVIRRSLVTTLDEVAIAGLFADGRPTALVFTAAAPLEVALDPPLNAMFELTGKSPIHAVQLLDQGPFSPDLVRRVLVGLVVTTADAEVTAATGPAEPPPDLHVKGVRDVHGVAQPTGSSEIATARQTDLHPLLADLLDLIRYRNLGQLRLAVYRGREVVREAAPPVNATRLIGFFDDTGPERDPTGWGVLRSLGLAASFRLYDLDASAFLTPAALHAALGDTLKIVLPRYAAAAAAARLGAPFGDIISSTEALAQLVSFHGSAPNDQRTADRIKADSLAFVQFELRPVAERLVFAGTREPAVQYATLVWTAEDQEPPPTEFPANGLVLDSRYFAPGVLVEIEPAACLDGSANRRSLMFNGWTEREFPVGGSDIVDQRLVCTRAGILDANGDEILGWVRLVRFFGDVKFDNADVVFFAPPLSPRVRLVLSPAPGADSGRATPDRLADARSPWGRFAVLPERWLAALHFGDGVDALAGVAAAGTGDTLDAVIEGLAPFTARPGSESLNQIPKAAPDADQAGKERARTERRTLAGRLAAWSQRFMDHGPGALVGEHGLLEPGAAFAMLTRPSPWRAAPDSDGLMSVLLFEKDRFGKTRKYALRPFGRYESLAIATLAAAHEPGQEAGAAAAVEQGLHTAWADAAKPNLLTPGVFGMPTPEPFLSTHFADIEIARSEPLAPPVILGTRSRADQNEKLGRFIEIAIARHPEEILADANIGTDASIAVRHVAVGFWRQFSAPDWVRRLERSINAPPSSIRELAPFGPLAVDGMPRLSPPRGLLVEDSTNVPVHIDELYRPLPDLWAGAYLLRLLNMPYGFRLLATAHLAAGVAVSLPNAASVEGPPCQLFLPWPANDFIGPQPEQPEHWQERQLDRPPFFDVTRTATSVTLEVSWPLVRLVDGMEADTRRLWFEGTQAPDIFRIPDPSVAYRLCVDTTDRAISVPEVLLSPVPDPGQPGTAPAAAMYVEEIIGARFKTAATSIVLVGQSHFELTALLGVEGQAAEPAPAVFSPRTGAAPPAPADFLIDAGDAAGWDNWVRIVPWPGATAVTLPASLLAVTLTPPHEPDVPALPIGPAPPPWPSWQQFKARVQTYVALLRTYDVAALPADVRTVASSVANALAPYAVDRVADWPGPKNGVAQPHQFTLPWVLGLPGGAPDISLGQADTWHWPPGDMASMGAASRAATALVFDGLAAKAAGDQARIDRLRALAGAVREAMRQFVIDQRRHLDDLPLAGIEPVTEALPINTNLANWPVSDAHDVLANYLIPAAPRGVAAVDAAFDAIEGFAGAGSTLAGLAAMRRKPDAGFSLAVRWSARGAIEPVLTALAAAGGGAAPRVDGGSMIVRAPLGSAEIGALRTAHADLPASAAAISRQMLFGARRTLVIQALLGQNPPLTQEVRSKP